MHYEASAYQEQRCAAVKQALVDGMVTTFRKTRYCASEAHFDMHINVKSQLKHQDIVRQACVPGGKHSNPQTCRFILAPRQNANGAYPDESQRNNDDSRKSLT